MKKLIILSIISFLLYSCDLLESDPLGPDTGMRFASIDAAVLWVTQNIAYAYNGKTGFIAAPSLTLKNMSGDRLDVAVLALKLIRDSGFGKHYLATSGIRVLISVDNKIIEIRNSGSDFNRVDTLYVYYDDIKTLFLH